jgi:hypothetical protein
VAFRSARDGKRLQAVRKSATQAQPRRPPGFAGGRGGLEGYPCTSHTHPARPLYKFPGLIEASPPTLLNQGDDRNDINDQAMVSPPVSPVEVPPGPDPPAIDTAPPDEINECNEIMLPRSSHSSFSFPVRIRGGHTLSQAPDNPDRCYAMELG